MSTFRNMRNYILKEIAKGKGVLYHFNDGMVDSYKEIDFELLADKLTKRTPLENTWLRKLLPCPFCGHEGQFYISSMFSLDNYYAVYCSNKSKCFMANGNHYIDQDSTHSISFYEAVKLWNKRKKDK